MLRTQKEEAVFNAIFDKIIHRGGWAKAKSVKNCSHRIRFL
jgi:hypothetical protein